MKRLKLILAIASLILSQNTFAQVYKQDVIFNGEIFLSKFPRGYKFYLQGPLPDEIKQVVITISTGSGSNLKNSQYHWNRTNTAEKRFVIFVTDPIKRGDGTINYSILFLHDIQEKNFAKKDNDPKPVEGLDTPPPNDNALVVEPVIGMGAGCVGWNDLNAKPKAESNTSTDFIGYAALKFHFKAVDKSKRYSTDKVYSYAKQRFSVIVGGITTQTSYKEQLLGNLFLNVKPMLGISFDITPDLSIESGIFGFRYLNTDPSLKPEYAGQVKTGFFIGFSMSADAFNRLRALLNSQSYNNTKNE